MQPPALLPTVILTVVAFRAGCQTPSRRLLMTQDRVNLAMLPITHDFIATMMGTDRSMVSMAAAALQKKAKSLAS
jgi:hypothetical protein